MDLSLAHGIEQFNKGEFFECHETLEDYWNELHGDEKLFVQGLIQAAVACYHTLNGNWRGAASQYEKSLAKLEKFAPERSGVDLGDLIEHLRACRAVVEQNLVGQNSSFPTELIPQIIRSNIE